MKKFLNIAAGILITIGALLIVGSVGAVDCDSIGLAQAWKQIMIGIAIVLSGTVAALIKKAVYRDETAI